MKRRDFLAGTALVAAGLTVVGRGGLRAQAAGGAAAGDGAEGWVPLRRNMGIFNGRGGTIGWLADNRARVAVDTQFPDTAARALALLRRGREGPLDVTINTHHHGDHTAGNGVFGPASRQLVAHANVPAAQRRQAKQRGTLDAQVYATTTFTDQWRMDLGDEVVAAKYFGPAHTSGDVVVYFEKANVAHLGDLMFNRLYPVIDGPAGANIGNWAKILDRIVAEYPADVIFVFGHGKSSFGVTGGREELAVLRDYLLGLLDFTAAQIAAGKSREEILTTANLPGFPDFHQDLPNQLGNNLGVAYDELMRAG